MADYIIDEYVLPLTAQEIEDRLNKAGNILGDIDKIKSDLDYLYTPDPESPKVWEEIQVLCRKGKASSVLEIGDVFNVVKDGVSYPFAVMDFITEEGKKGSLQIKDRNLTTGVIFQSLETLYNLQFDAREAFYATDTGLSAGTYNFVLEEKPMYNPDTAGKTFQFTLTQDIPAGGQLVWTQPYNVTFEGASIDVFSSPNSTEKIESVIMTEGSNGTTLGASKNTINGNFNAGNRGLYGSGRWETSAIRQQLNSDAIAGSVWTPQTKWDRPPSWVASTKGFLNGLDEKLKKCIADVEVNTYNHSVDGNGLCTTTDKVFLAGANECHFIQRGSDDGIAYEFYRIGSQYSSPSDNDDPIRIKKSKTGYTEYYAEYWFLRSPYDDFGYPGTVYMTTSSGGISGNSVFAACGIAPVFVIA